MGVVKWFRLDFLGEDDVVECAVAVDEVMICCCLDFTVQRFQSSFFGYSITNGFQRRIIKNRLMEFRRMTWFEFLSFDLEGWKKMWSFVIISIRHSFESE